MEPGEINLKAEDRFVPTAVLRDAYLPYAESRNPNAPPYVAFEDRGLELGIVASEVPEIARGVSSLLSRSLEDARNDKGGHLPTPVVQRVQREIISPHGVANLWGRFGHRFVLSRPAGPDTRELVSTILVGSRRQSIFFLTGRYNNLRHSIIEETVDFDQPYADDPTRRWFDLFDFPDVAAIKPRSYHHIANFVVAKEARGEGLSRFLLSKIRETYARDFINDRGLSVVHNQRELCGRGFWQIGDPPWLERMERLGFRLRWGAESFFIEQDWAPLPPIFDGAGEPIDNVSYNASFGLPDRYLDAERPDEPALHLLDRVPHVIELARNPRAKLQYFQTMFDF